MRSGTELSQFLRVLLPTLPYILSLRSNTGVMGMTLYEQTSVL